MAKQYLDLTGLTKYDELIKAFIRDPTKTSYVTTNTDQDITGIKTFSGQLQVSDPSQDKDAANKSYADALNARYVSTSILGG